MAHHPDHNVQVMTDCHDICLQTLSHPADDHAAPVILAEILQHFFFFPPRKFRAE
jgi:hypothetical protein